MQVKYSSVRLACRTQNSMSINTHICRDPELDFSLEKTLRAITFYNIWTKKIEKKKHILF